ncbi:MAG TPA: glycosyl hydrolase family 65 protein [Thermotogota bacterium]|nr:glycosyl hydrolase family 65 protein [Thermotogota bacterium]
MRAIELTEDRWDPAAYPLHETLFAQANGYLGIRGSFEEGFSGSSIKSIRGTYINGFYENEKILYGESAYGFAKINQIMLHIPDATRLRLAVDGEPVFIDNGRLWAYKRHLSLTGGILVRTVDWESSQGKRVLFCFERLASLQDPHLLAMRLTMRPLNFFGTIEVVSLIDGDVQNIRNEEDPRVGSQSEGFSLDPVSLEALAKEGLAKMILKTRHSELTLGCSIHHLLAPEPCESPLAFCETRQAAIRYAIRVHQGQEAVLTKIACYTTSLETPVAEIDLFLRQKGAHAIQEGFEAYATAQTEILSRYWRVAETTVEDQPEIERALAVNQFHLYQSVGKDGRRNVASKGLTGEGYGGHTFWDTEIYMIPFFIFREPNIARKLLEYRYGLLPFARERARTMGHHQGALYPWRTIAGEECSAYYPAGTAQYHINADIAYAIRQYWQVTQDDDFLVKKGAEILFETARLWSDLGHFNPERDGQFTLEGVTGPDEYTAVIDNNYYTNRMAQEHLHFAAETAKWLQQRYPVEYERLGRSLGLSEAEPAEWEEKSGRMYFPQRDRRGITPQDDSFLSLRRWDFKGTPPDHYPLLLHYHPLVIYRHQVCKQADVVLAHLLAGESVSLEQKKRDFDYYEPLTTHDSSLSPCIYGMMAAEVGYPDKAEAYFTHTLFLDLHNLHHNSVDGAHLAAMAGSWMTLVYGFAGLRTPEGTLSFNPILPASWNGYAFRLYYRGSLLEVRAQHASVTYTLMEGGAIGFRHKERSVQLTRQRPKLSL